LDVLPMSGGAQTGLTTGWHGGLDWPRIRTADLGPITTDRIGQQSAQLQPFDGAPTTTLDHISAMILHLEHLIHDNDTRAGDPGDVAGLLARTAQ
jgi:hypothetical protein